MRKPDVSLRRQSSGSGSLPFALPDVKKVWTIRLFFHLQSQAGHETDLRPRGSVLWFHLFRENYDKCHYGDLLDGRFITSNRTELQIRGKSSD